MKHNSDVPGQLALFAIPSTIEKSTIIHDPYWDEVEIAPEHPQPEDRWNPADFGEVPHKVEGDGQLSIFCDDSGEPPDPDDYRNLDDYNKAWTEWVGVKVGDLVKLSSTWMDKCALACDRNFKKNYQYKSDEELICEVIRVDPLTGHTYVERGNNKSLFVPAGFYTVESVRAQVTSSTVVTTVETPVRAQVALDTGKVAPEQNTHWVERYWVQRNTNKYFYYRYCWMVGRKKNRVHLGSVDSIIARRKKADVEVWISDGKLPIEITDLIKGWKHEPSTMPKM